MPVDMTRREILSGAACIAAAPVVAALPTTESEGVFEWLEQVELNAYSLEGIKAPKPASGSSFHAKLGHF